MKISEFAAKNNVTTKMLRHYDEIGLLKPAAIDPMTGYRSYEEEQSMRMSWIVILKNLDFSLQQIQELLGESVGRERFIKQLRRKRIEISLQTNEQYQKSIQINKLIEIIEKEGIKLDRNINLLEFNMENVNELKKNMPNMECYLEAIDDLMEICPEGSEVSMLRFDISHFKSLNDDLGYEIGDRVILACYQVIRHCMESLKERSTIARMGGDEFAVFLLAGEEELVAVCKDILRTLTEYDFKKLGCDRTVTGKIGGLTGRKPPRERIRHLLDETIEALQQAAIQGPGSVVIERF